MMLAFESGRVRRALGCLAAGACSLFVPAIAGAQNPPATDVEPAPAPAPAQPSSHMNLTGDSPTIDLSTPPPPALVGRKYHQHDGFYVRVSGGLGSLLSASADIGDVSFSSGGLSLDVDALIGGSPAAGFSVGGGLLASLQLSGDWELDNGVGTDSADLTSIIVGPFADGYPAPNGGWHFGGLLGLASVSFQEPGGDEGSNALGVGGAFWTGYDVWVAPDWSVGGSLQFDALRATNSDDDLTISKIGATLKFSVLYN